MDQKNQSKENYSAENIEVLKGLEAVRKRPAMYIGDISSKGLHHLVYEVVDNSIDEALVGYCNNIEVIIHTDNSITVEDDGRGIPVDELKEEGKSALEVVMTVLHAGGKFNKDSYKVSGGLHGVGVSCVNALSSHLKAEVFRDGKIYEQDYSKGDKLNDVHVVGDSKKTGTRITFKPDMSIFIIEEYKYDILASRLRELSYLNKGIKLTLTDEREKDDDGNLKKDTFYSDEGLSEFIKYLDGTRDSLSNIVHFSSDKNSEIPIEVALRYNTSYSENVYAYVNNINTIEGGTHVTGFRRGLTRTLKKYGDQSKMFEKLKFEITGDDFREGLTAIISVKVAEPQFEGQTKTKLGNSEVSLAVDQAISTALQNFLEENPKEAKTIIQKVILSATARHAAKNARELVQRKSVLTGGGLPGKLSDCSEKDPEQTEIFLVEGDSAGGTAKQGRDRRFQAILPLRGKILNVEKALEHKIFDNEEIKNIFTALGVSIGTEEDHREINLEKLRYHKTIIMTDADVDGSHIATLIMTLFFRYMKKLVELGYLYIATPPLYLIKYGKERTYCWTEGQREQASQEILSRNPKANINLQRYKGLGEMNAEQLWQTTMNPETRTLRQVTIDSAAEADRVFSMLMGDDVPLRREFIETNAKYANIDT
ncbi:MAG: DNA topoisomerase (ATP-hydrolyzing) subunit B [Bacteroidales bacterium]|nr:DNA topoisomerase (ATP-hydrolyzing) subunit B [Bacteroidales bacterium]